MPSRYEKNEKIRKSKKAKKRKKIFRRVIIFFIILLVLILLWGKFGEVNILTVNDYRLKNENIPESFNGLKIIHFSDLHYGTGFNENRLKTLTNKINSYKPDIVVFTGDLIDKNYNANDNDFQILVKYLSSINSTLGKYAIVGNHDFYNDNYENIMYDSLFKVLKNNYDTIYYKENIPILIYGMDNITYGNPRIDILNKDSIANIKYKIVLLHEPDYVDEFINDYDISLILAGHSHNGQVNVPLLKSLLLPENAKNYYNKYYKVNKTDFYISNGVGSSIYDFRLFSPPSINIYRLTNK